jgi:hypothetical protein
MLAPLRIAKLKGHRSLADTRRGDKSSMYDDAQEKEKHA